MGDIVKLRFDDNFEGEEKEVLDRLIALQLALCKKDIAGMSDLLYHNFVLVRGSGRKELKQEFLRDIRKDVLHYVETKIKNPKITVDGNKATINVKIYIKTRVTGAQIIWDLKSRFLLKKKEGEWYFTEWDTT
ncbi:MAG: hypothetical protein BZ137_01485 [Methanosphaera sp. rholeuAM130]|nr:MAG: hypothetical protein BZ137_01485 [Methanosphaera sp. rholeuAM130]